MNAFPDDHQGRSDEDPLGPATPRRSELEHEDDDALLPPFARGRAVPPAASAGEAPMGESAVGETVAGETAVEETPMGETPVGETSFGEIAEDERPFAFEAAEGETGGDDADEELPWLVTAEEGEAARRADAAAGWGGVAGESAGGGEAAPEGEMPDWLDLGGAAELEQKSDDAPSGGEPDISELTHTAALAGEGSGSDDEATEGAPALAERFESIARLLRARGVAGVLESGERDPLGLLLTGFALGYLQRDEDAGS